MSTVTGEVESSFPGSVGVDQTAVSNICFLLQVAAAEEPVGSVLLDWAVGGQLPKLASTPEEGALCPASRGRPVLDGLLRFHQVDRRNINLWGKKTF